MSLLRELASSLFRRADQRLVGEVVSAVSVDTDETRERLRVARRPFLDPAETVRPSWAEVEQTSEFVIRQARVKVGALGGMASLAGLLSVPPEVVATAVAGLRLAQRLAIIHGFDPDTDRGEMAVFRALAAGFEVSLPERGAMAVRVSDLPKLVLQRTVPDPASAGGTLVASVARQSASLVGRRVTRLVPVVFSGWSAVAARDRMDDIGRRMAAVLRRLAEAPEVGANVEDAVEVA